MKIARFWLGLLLVSLASASAQVVVEVTLDQDQFLPGEAMPVAVRIINRSGQTLHLGADPDWLTFSIESRDGAVAAKSGEVPVLGAFDLETAEVATKRVDLAPYFTLSHEGRYGITAALHIKNWDREIDSRPKLFDIIQGSKLWEQQVGVPPTGSATNLPPQLRTYVLQQANYLRGRLRLYLRVLDEYSKPVKVVPIGPMVSFGRPDPPQIDRECNLHVLYQNGAASFSYTVFSPDGDLIVRQFHDYVSTRPRMKVDDSGQISVIGGTRRLTSNDVPPSSLDDSDDEPASTVSPASGSSSNAVTSAQGSQKSLKP